MHCVRTLVWGVVVAGLALPSSLFAAPPALIPYVGHLTTDGGAPFDGAANFVVTLHADANTSDVLWGPEAHNAIAVEAGIASFVLGSLQTFSPGLFASGALWLEVTVDGTTLSPRQQLLSVPFALQSADAERLGGVLPEDYLLAGGDADVTSITVDAGIQLGNDTATCDASKAGTIRWTSTAFEGCDGNDWVALGASNGTGSTQASAGATCKAILDAGNADGDKVYWVDPNGGGTTDAFRVYCDMSGGGWMMALHYVAGAHTLSSGTGSIATDNFMYCDETTSCAKGFDASRNPPGPTFRGNLDLRAAALPAASFTQFKVQCDSDTHTFSNNSMTFEDNDGNKEFVDATHWWHTGISNVTRWRSSHYACGVGLSAANGTHADFGYCTDGDASGSNGGTVAGLSIWNDVVYINCGAHGGGGELGSDYRIWIR